jgi:hypothetical protein
MNGERTHTHTHTHTHILEYYSAIKKNEISLFARKLMELKIIMLSEISLAQKFNIICFLSYAESIPKMIVTTILMGH